MPPVKVINETEDTIILKEGISALYKRVAEIPKGGNYVVRIDQNATYREFVCVESKNKVSCTLTSDDCIDNEVVRIVYDANKSPIKLQWTGTRRRINILAEATTDRAIGNAVKGVIPWLLTWFKKKNSSTANITVTSEPSVRPQPPSLPSA